MKYVRSVIALAGLCLGSVLLLVTLLLGLIDRSGRAAWQVTRVWAWLTLYTSGMAGLSSRGFEKLANLKSAIIMSNHESLLDPVLVMALSKTPVRFLARRELFYLPLFGWAMWANGHLAVNRGESADALFCLRRARAALSRGSLLCVYPEGRRSSGADLLPFKKGGFLLALQTGVPIVPVGIARTAVVCPKGWHMPGRAPLTAVVGQPIETEALTVRQLDALMADVRDRILRLRRESNSCELV